MSIPSRNVCFTKPAEPSFLKAFKAQVGYKEPAGIEAKRPVPTAGGSDDRKEVERDDELPTVVVLREGDVGEREFMEMRQNMKEEGAADKTPSDVSASIPTVSPRPLHGEAPNQSDDSSGKIKFKKPVKRASSEEKAGVLDASSSKRLKQDDSARDTGAATIVVGGVTRRRRSSGGESKSRQVKNSSLLSFGGGEEEN